MRLNSALAAAVAAAFVSSFSSSGFAQAIPGYVQTNLVSNIPGLAAHTDPNLVNPWGIAESGGSPFWLSDNGAGLATLYNTSGTPQATVVAHQYPRRQPRRLQWGRV